MDRERFARLAWTLSVVPTRRAVLSLAAALGLPNLIDGEARKHKKRRQKCGPCQTCRKGKRKPRQDDTACLGTGRCLQGRCNPLPTCVQALEGCPPAGPAGCCSGGCTQFQCNFSGTGAPCADRTDCFLGAPCVGYRCQPA